MQITILACANAAGTVIPLMVIFDVKCLNSDGRREKYRTLYTVCLISSGQIWNFLTTG